MPAVLSYDSMLMMGKDVRKNFPEGNCHLARCTWLMCDMSYRGKKHTKKGPVSNPLVLVRYWRMIRSYWKHAKSVLKVCRKMHKT